MKLVIYGANSLDQMESMVREKFSSVPRKELLCHSMNSSLPLKSCHFMKKILIKPVKKLRSMTLSWQMPSQFSLYKWKAAEFLSNFIGHEGKGSILSILKNQGFATALSCGITSEASSYSIFEVSAELTIEGFGKMLSNCRKS